MILDKDSASGKCLSQHGAFKSEIFANLALDEGHTRQQLVPFLVRMVPTLSPHSSLGTIAKKLVVPYIGVTHSKCFHVTPSLTSSAYYQYTSMFLVDPSHDESES